MTRHQNHFLLWAWFKKLLSFFILWCVDICIFLSKSFLKWIQNSQKCHTFFLTSVVIRLQNNMRYVFSNFVAFLENIEFILLQKVCKRNPFLLLALSKTSSLPYFDSNSIWNLLLIFWGVDITHNKRWHHPWFKPIWRWMNWILSTVYNAQWSKH